VAPSSAVSLAVAADTGCVFAAEMGAWGSPGSGQQWGFLPCREAALGHGSPANLFLSRLPLKAERLEGRMALQSGHWAARTELRFQFLLALSRVVLGKSLKLCFLLLHFRNRSNSLF